MAAGWPGRGYGGRSSGPRWWWRFWPAWRTLWRTWWRPGPVQRHAQCPVRSGGAVTAVSLVIEGDRITRIYAMRNPNKLGWLEAVAELRR